MQIDAFNKIRRLLNPSSVQEFKMCIGETMSDDEIEEYIARLEAKWPKKTTRV